MVELKGKQLLATAILSLMALGGLSYAALPEAYCPLEDKTVKYIYMSESQKTVTKILPSEDEGGYSIMDDRCQKGTSIGQWIPVKSESVQKTCPVKIIAYTDNGKYYCTGDDCVNKNFELMDINDLGDI